MSASLVGSEMCIRDRVHHKMFGRHQETYSDSSSRKVRCRPTSTSCSPSPVSYTHLTLPTICSV
eukprot:8780610-Alexandrium_andersonii.AAC.1